MVAAALGAPPGPVARLCDDATAAGLLAPGRDVGAVYRFRHALIRETLYAELAPQARAQAHHKIAAVLETAVPGNPGGRSHAELAYHFLRAAPVSAEAAARAVHHSRLAGQEALTALAYEEAAGHFRHALDVQRRAAQSTPASRAGLLLSLAEALTKTGPDPAAVQAIDEAVRLARHAGRAAAAGRRGAAERPAPRLQRPGRHRHRAAPRGGRGARPGRPRAARPHAGPAGHHARRRTR